MRGEVCVGIGSILSFAAMMMLIFTHVGQINTSSPPRSIYLAKVNVSELGEAIHHAIIDPVFGLYTTNASAPLMERAGLRQFYEFGLYSHCGYVEEAAGRCSNHTFGYRFTPYEAVTLDMAGNFSNIVSAIIRDTTFRDSTYLGDSTKAAFWMIFLATLCAGVTFLTGVIRHNYTFLISSLFAVFSSILSLIGAAIWTILIVKSQSISRILVGPEDDPVPIGIHVSPGTGLYLLWASWACLLVSTIPYWISCCTYRG